MPIKPSPGPDLKRVYKRLHAAYGGQRWWPADSPFEVIVGAILTQNTAWRNVELAIRNLKSTKALSFKKIGRISRGSLAKLIRPSGFFNVKAARLKALIGHIKKHHTAGLKAFLSQPAARLREELLSVPGVGRETADCIVLYAADKPVFVVDAYTRRIFYRLGLLNDPAEDYDRIRAWIEGALGRNTALFGEYHALIVRHAKEHCRKTPACPGCPLENLCAKRVEVQ